MLTVRLAARWPQDISATMLCTNCTHNGTLDLEKAFEYDVLWRRGFTLRLVARHPYQRRVSPKRVSPSTRPVNRVQRYLSKARRIDNMECKSYWCDGARGSWVVPAGIENLTVTAVWFNFTGSKNLYCILFVPNYH